MKIKVGISLVAAMVLAGCGGGGGGGGGTVTGSPEGVYEGNSSAGKYFNTIVLENNLYYTIYGEIIGSVFAVEGMMTGTGTANNGSFSSSNLKDFSAFGGSATGTLTAAYDPGVRFNGSTTSGGNTVTFTAAPPKNSSYNYNAAPTPSNLTGSWNMTTLAGDSATLNISSGGAYTGTSEGCSFAGTVTPRASGKNVYDVSVNFGPSPCLLPNQSLSAHAVEYLLANNQRQLIVAGSDAGRNNVTVLLGAR